jgi:hypothetical protein
VTGWASSVVNTAREAPAAALRLVDKLIDFLDSGWKTFKRKLGSVGFGEVVSTIRDALDAVARAVKATEFSLEISTTGVSYQFSFAVDPQGVVVRQVS